MTSSKAKENARLGYWCRQFKKRYFSLKGKFVGTSIDLHKSQEKELEYAVHIDDLTIRLLSSQHDLMKTNSLFLSLLSNTQRDTTKIINQLIATNKEAHKETRTLRIVIQENVKELEKEKTKAWEKEEYMLALEKWRIVKEKAKVRDLKEDVPIKKYRYISNYEPRRMEVYVQLIKIANTFDEWMYFENRILEAALSGDEVLLERNEESIENDETVESGENSDITKNSDDSNDESVSDSYDNNDIYMDKDFDNNNNYEDKDFDNNDNFEDYEDYDTDNSE